MNGRPRLSARPRPCLRPTWSVLLPLLAFLLLLAACGGQPKATGPIGSAMKSYTNQKQGFAVDHPGEFGDLVRPSDNKASLWIGWGKNTPTGNAVGFCVAVDPQPAGATQAVVDKAMASSLTQARAYAASGKPVPGHPDMVVSRAAAKALAGHQWLYMEGTRVKNNVVTLYQSYTFETTSAVYALTFWAAPADFDRWGYATAFDRIAQTFRFLK